jgi:hypothetical protein
LANFRVHHREPSVAGLDGDEAKGLPWLHEPARRIYGESLWYARPFMSARPCNVSYRDVSGIRHVVRVHAEGVREAACLALVEFRKERKKGDWGEPPGTATTLTIEVLPPPITHEVRVADVMRWLEGGASDPAKAVEKARLRKLLE